MKDRVCEWIDFARIDLLSAIKLSDDENLTIAAAFHAHQCCEKAFKALIEYSEKPVPKIHDLIKLYNDVKHELKFSPDEDILDDLSRVYIDSRYPSMIGQTSYSKPPLNDVKKYIRLSNKVLEQVIKVVAQ